MAAGRIQTAKAAHQRRAAEREAGHQGDDPEADDYLASLREVLLMTGLALSHGQQDFLLVELRSSPRARRSTATRWWCAWIPAASTRTAMWLSHGRPRM